jgi:hypothetical protein
VNTTVAIIEILVVGFFSCVWLLLAALRVADIEWSTIAPLLDRWSNWSAAATGIGALAAYQIGWLVNGLSRGMMWPFAKSELHRVFGGRQKYEEARAFVYQYGSPRVHDDTALEQSVIRLARGGVLNFSIIGVLLVTGWSRREIIAAVIFMVLALGSLFQWRYRNRRYYERLYAVHQTLSQNHGVKPNMPLQPTPGAGDAL